MMELHGFPMSPNTKRARMMLEELALPYRFVQVDLMGGEHRGEAYRALNPTSRVPTLVDGDVRLWESNAILVYLAEKHPEQKLAGGDARERGEVARWMYMNAAHLSPATARIFAHTVRLPEDKRLPQVVEEARAEFARSLAAIEAQLAGKDFLVGRFTIADISLATTIAPAPMLGIDLSGSPEVSRWLKSIQARPAWAKLG